MCALLNLKPRFGACLISSQPSVGNTGSELLVLLGEAEDVA